MSERKALGRGLKSLIPSIPVASPEPSAKATRADAEAGEITTTLVTVGVCEIRRNPRQPRRRFSEKALEDLTESIRRSGILQPILVRRTPDGFELLAGERRLRAARRAGLTHVPAVIHRANDQSQLEVALVENLQREDLNPIEEAQGYRRLTQEFSLTQEEVAAKVGKDRSTITNLLRLLKLAPAVQELLVSGSLSMGHARALLSVDDLRRQEVLAQRIEKEGLSVRQVERIVRAMTGGQKKRRVTDTTEKNVSLRHLADEIQRVIGTRVEVVEKGKGGEVRLHYYSAEDLARLTERLLR